MYAQDQNRFGSKQTQFKYGSQLAGFQYIELSLRHAKLSLAKYPHACVQKHNCPKVWELFSFPVYLNDCSICTRGFPNIKGFFQRFPYFLLNDERK